MHDPPESFDAEPIPDARPVIDPISIANVIPTARPMASPEAPLLNAPRDDFLLEISPRSSALRDVFTFVGAMVAFDLLIGFAMRVLVDAGGAPESPAAEQAMDRKMLLPMLGLRAGATAFFIAMILRLRHQTPRSIGFTAKRWPMDILIGLGATIGVYGLIYLAMMTMWMLWPGVTEQMNENVEIIKALIPNHPLGFVAIAITVGFYEELAFRGFLMTRLRRATGSWALAVLLSTAIFTGLHAFDQTLAALVPVAILSFSFSLLTIWRRSLIPAIVAHALFDLCQLMFLYFIAGDSWT